MNRRSFMRLGFLVSAYLLSPPTFSLAGKSEPQPNATPLLDVHHHIIPEIYRETLASIGIKVVNGGPLPPWTPQYSLDAMDRLGIDSAVTSISAPGVYFGDAAHTRDLARKVNEFTAEMISNHPRRFGGFAVLPLPDIDSALDELSYALDQLKLDGVILLSNVDGMYLGSPQLNALHEELNKRQAVVYIHPTEPAHKKYPETGIAPSLFEFVFDTTRTVASLIQYNTLNRFPDISFILAHAGGTAPYLVWKMEMLSRISSGNKSAAEQLRNLYYDTSLSASSYSLNLLQDLAGSEHILYGSDLPFAPEHIVADSLFELHAYSGFTAEQREAVYRNNLLSLFPRFTTISS